jgi:hypothetical protein
MTIAAQMAAEGESQRAIGKKLALSEYLVKKLMREVVVNQAIANARVSDVIPRKLDRMADAVMALVDTVTTLEQRMARYEEVARMMRKAMQRMTVENKNVREQRNKAKQELRQVKKDLWTARGYKA